jgi:4-hydroxy-tetrahydrodipicolinate reductase
MTNIIISGFTGQMGRAVAELAKTDPEIRVTAGIARRPPEKITFPYYSSFDAFQGSADALIDFSSPVAVDDGLLEFCREHKIPPVLCTTGYSAEQLERIHTLSQYLPVFKTANLSIGINLLADIVKDAAAKLGIAFDIEIVEAHHRRKLDAPSGTALMLAESAAKGRQAAIGQAAAYVPARTVDASDNSGKTDEAVTELIFDRSGRRELRPTNEIGVSAVRGGTIPGEHSVIFAGHDEVIEFKHTVYSREVFAAGALRAAKFIASVKVPGLFTKF